MYHEKILKNTIKPGYACDNLAGLLFNNGKFVEAVSLNNENNSYYISVKNGEIIEEKINSEIIE